MDIKVIDNFLSYDELNSIKNLFGLEPSSTITIPLHYSSEVANLREETSYWNYYFTHVFYDHDKPMSHNFDQIYNMFIPKFEKIYSVKSLLRCKLNFYPHTETLREHGQHTDYPFSHYGAVFSLHTCDGFTRLYDGTTIPSVENRMLFFDPSLKHNSSTTTNYSGRRNINFNFL